MLPRTFSTSIIPHSSQDKSIVRSKSWNFGELSRDWKQSYLIYLLSSLLIHDKKELQQFLQKLSSFDLFTNYNFHHFSIDPLQKMIVPYTPKQSIFSPFENFEYVGEGTFGKVYHCHHKLDEKEYAIKEIQISNEQNYLDEIRILSELYHPNIIRYYNSWKQNNCLMIQMEYCPSSLRLYLEKDPRDLTILHQIVHGLCYLHEKKYIHFDLKPENILLTETNQVKLADFGYSRSVLTSIYTSHYYEPSLYLCKNDVEYTTAIDVYSFGILLLEFILPKTTTQSEKLLMIASQLRSREWNTCFPQYHSLLTKCLEPIQSKRISCIDILTLYF